MLLLAIAYRYRSRTGGTVPIGGVPTLIRRSNGMMNGRIWAAENSTGRLGTHHKSWYGDGLMPIHRDHSKFVGLKKFGVERDISIRSRPIKYGS